MVQGLLLGTDTRVHTAVSPRIFLILHKKPSFISNVSCAMRANDQRFRFLLTITQQADMIVV